jgi:hypothetical protein
MLIIIENIVQIKNTHFHLNQTTLDWFQSMTDSHKRMYNDETYRKSISARTALRPLRIRVDFDVEPDSKSN